MVIRSLLVCSFFDFVLSYVNDEVIVRQRDPPSNFHLILTGAATVTFMRVIDGHVQTLALLTRGGTFGVSGDDRLDSIRSSVFEGKRINHGHRTDRYRDVEDGFRMFSSLQGGSRVSLNERFSRHFSSVHEGFSFDLHDQRSAVQQRRSEIPQVNSFPLFTSFENVFSNRNNVPFLRGFPIDRLYEFPHAIQHCSFR